MKQNSWSAKINEHYIDILALALGLWLLILGASLGIGTISLAQNEKRLLSEGTSTIGKIINVELDYGNKGSIQKIFTVEYTDRANKVLSLTDRQAYSRTEGSPGTILNEWKSKNVTVFYDPDNTSNSVVEGWQDSRSDIIWKFVGVTLFAILSLWLIWPIIADIRKSTRSSKRTTKP